MKAKRNSRGRFHNPQPSLFIGLKDNPDQTLLFDAVDDDPEPAAQWTSHPLFAKMETNPEKVRDLCRLAMLASDRYVLCREIADGWLVIFDGDHNEVMNELRASKAANRTNYYRVSQSHAAIGSIVDAMGEEVYP